MLRKDYAVWQCGNYEISLSRPRIMGVVNVTPDSFSDGGQHICAEDAISYGLDLLDAGADIIDVGGESTRPGFTPVSPEEEASRVVPVVRALAEAGAIVSIDTRHASVAKMCVRLGASIINDVTGFTDPEMIQVAADSGAGCIVMHAGEVSGRVPRRSVTLDTTAQAREMRQAAKKGIDETNASLDLSQEEEAVELATTKTTPQLDEVMKKSARGYGSSVVHLASGRRFTLPEEAPIMRQIMGFLGDRARDLVRAGVSRERICIDPGAGFGKYADEDVVIQRATAKLSSMGYPLMCAVSRKRLIGAVSGVYNPADRDDATIGVCLSAINSGARILRVHDVEGVAQAVNSYWAVSQSDPRRAFIALGSNTGDKMGYLKSAVQAINDLALTCVIGVSDAYDTEPAYGIATSVVDAVVEIRTELAPLVLMDALLGIEASMGRVRDSAQNHCGPRTIDLDLLWMEGEYHAGRKLQLPHPRLGERDFVLVPMKDLMHDPDRFFKHEGVRVLDQEFRVGKVTENLGQIDWEA